MLDDVTDPVFELADWVCAIQRDGAGTVRIGPSWRSRLVANRDRANALQIQVWNENDDIRPALNVCVTTEVVIEAFRSLLNDIEQHPCFASNWVCFICLSDEQYDHLSDEADKLWEQGVSQGYWSDDWDRQVDFHARYVAERIELTPEQVDVVERYRTRLRAAIERL